MAIRFVYGSFIREDQRLLFGTSRTGIARVDAEVKDELFQGYRKDLSVIESVNGELTIVPSDKDKNADAVWLFVALPRWESEDERPRDAFMIAPGRQGIDCRASFNYLLDFGGWLYDVLVIKAKDGDRFCYVGSYDEPWFFEGRQGDVYANTLPEYTMDAIKDSLSGMIVFTDQFDKFHPDGYWVSVLETFSYVFGVAKRVYCGLKISDMDDVKPDSAGLVVM